MKQLLVSVLFGLVFSIPAVTSQTSGFSQRGKVTNGLQANGLSIAHSSLPLNSKAKVVNTSTGKEAEATVIRQIPASPDRIADVSMSLWQELGLAPGTDVRIYTNASLEPQTTALPAARTTQTETSPPPVINNR